MSRYISSEHFRSDYFDATASAFYALRDSGLHINPHFSGHQPYDTYVHPTWAKCPYCGKRNKISDTGECMYCLGALDARVL